MKKTVILGLFCCAALVQLVVPIQMILQHEQTLRTGRQFRFRTAPVEPRDALGSQYVVLRTEANTASLPVGVKAEDRQKVYVLIEEDKGGFAQLTSATLTRPQGDAYIKAKVSYSRGRTVHLEMPFDRYYINEQLAPAAEQAYRQHSHRDARDAYITVRVRSGFAVLEDLYIGGKPIGEFLRETSSSPTLSPPSVR